MIATSCQRVSRLVLACIAAVSLAGVGLAGCGPSPTDWTGEPPFPGRWSWIADNNAELQLLPDGTAKATNMPLVVGGDHCDLGGATRFSGEGSWRRGEGQEFLLAINGSELPFTYSRNGFAPDWSSIFVGLCDPVDSGAKWNQFVGEAAY